MNLVLFEPDELATPLPRTDRRVQHVLSVLRRNVGETLDAGIVNGPRGKATVAAIAAETVTFSFAATMSPEPPEPITLVVGLPRPQTARDILRDATTLGVAAIHFVRTEKAEASYAQSTLWTSGEWRRHVLHGAEQAFSTRVPTVTFGRTLAEVVAESVAPAHATSDAAATTRLALDNYESAQPLGMFSLPVDAPVLIAIGAERGWSARERELLRFHGFAFVHLGPRVLRTETAATAALSIARAKLGRM